MKVCPDNIVMVSSLLYSLDTKMDKNDILKETHLIIGKMLKQDIEHKLMHHEENDCGLHGQ